MIRSILFLTILNTLSLQLYSQVVFENGYFIDDTDQRTECLIKNLDWKNNPTQFEYKISGNETVQRATIETIKEFGIVGVSKYTRAKVKIDRSSDAAEKLGSERNPNFQEEQLFLKVLVEGKASLFSYVDGNLTRFFFQLNDTPIGQLVYKRYLSDHNIAQNNLFRQQLVTQLMCQENTSDYVRNLKYNQKDLTRFFIKYNECVNASYTHYGHTEKRDLFNLSFRAGVNLGDLTVQNSTATNMDVDFENRKSFRFGIETEFILPYNKNKWSIIIEPTYHYYKSDQTTTANNVPGGVLFSRTNYTSVELPTGVRHYFFLNNESKIFADVSYIFDFPYNSSIEFRRSSSSTLEVSSSRSFALGAGYKYKDRYSLEIRYLPGRGILGDYWYWKSEYRTLSIIVGYSMF